MKISDVIESLPKNTCLQRFRLLLKRHIRTHGDYVISEKEREEIEIQMRAYIEPQFEWIDKNNFEIFIKQVHDVKHVS